MIYRVRQLWSYPRRRQENWERPCGCSFKARLFGSMHIQCLDHYLD